jgi:hypothetical protein
VYINDGDFLKPLICLFAYKEILPYVEICFSYFGLDEVVAVDEEEEEAEPQPVRGKGAKNKAAKKNMKGKQGKSSGAAKDLVVNPQVGNRKSRCFCGQKNCAGYMFK